MTVFVEGKCWEMPVPFEMFEIVGAHSGCATVL